MTEPDDPETWGQPLNPEGSEQPEQPQLGQQPQESAGSELSAPPQPPGQSGDDFTDEAPAASETPELSTAPASPAFPEQLEQPDATGEPGELLVPEQPAVSAQPEALYLPEALAPDATGEPGESLEPAEPAPVAQPESIYPPEALAPDEWPPLPERPNLRDIADFDELLALPPLIGRHELQARTEFRTSADDSPQIEPPVISESASAPAGPGLTAEPWETGTPEQWEVPAQPEPAGQPPPPLPRKLTAQQRTLLIVLTVILTGSLLGGFALILPKVSPLPQLLAPLFYVSPTPFAVGATAAAATVQASGNGELPWYSSTTPGLAEEPGPTSTPGVYFSYLPDLQNPGPTAQATLKPEPPPVPPTPDWPNGRNSMTASKLGVHVVRNDDPFVMEYVRRVRPRVMKAVDDVGWLAEAKAVSPNTVTVARINDQNEDWVLTKSPEQAARDYVAQHLNSYKLNEGADYWEGWNEFVPDSAFRWNWYAAFEAARACEMQAHGLRAAVGGFPMGFPEYNDMALFMPALQAAHRCGGIFTLHEGVSPLFGCGVFRDRAGIIPGAPYFGGQNFGYLMLRYRFWYEGYLKPAGIGDLKLVISELTVGGLIPSQTCNGPGGPGWKGYSDWWVQHGVGPTGAQSWANLLAWYDSEMRQDSYVLGTTVFTAGGAAFGQWNQEDIHDVLIPLAYYAVAQN